MPIIVDGKKIAADILDGVRQELLAFKEMPVLAAVLVGDDEASLSFLREKRKKCEALGIGFVLHRFDATVTTTFLRRKLYEIRRKKNVRTLIIQLPLPPHLNTQYILDAVPSEQDADMLSSRSKGLLISGKSKIFPPTVAAILHTLEICKVKIESLHCVLVGLGPLVGRPLLQTLADKAASITAVHKITPDIARFTREADVLVAGAGHPKLITADMVKEGVVALDAGYGRIGATVSGDFDFEGVAKKARIITPVPGGIGPITVAMLLKNVVMLAKNRS